MKCLRLTIFSFVATLCFLGCDKAVPEREETPKNFSDATKQEAPPLVAASPPQVTEPPASETPATIQPVENVSQPPKFEGVNLALHKTATNTSNWSPPLTRAENAVDGNTDGILSNGSVTHTQPNPKGTVPWLDVDLGEEKKISGIVLWNRTDCCGSRLSNYWIFVSNSPFSPTDTPNMIKKRKDLAVKVKGELPNPYYALDGHQVKGRYIRIQLDDSIGGEGMLSLAEVQVFGE